MKKLFFTALPFLIASCSEKTSEETSSLSDNAGKKFTLEVVDTLFIDSGEDIILIENQKARTDFSDDLKYYFNYNYKQNLIDVINLKEHKLERQIPFETEGPNGTTSYVSSIDHFDQDKFMINNFNHGLQIFDSTGQKLESFRLNNDDLRGDSLNTNESINTSGIIDPITSKYYSIYGNGFGAPLGIAIIDIKSKTLTKKPIKGLDAIKVYKVDFIRDGGRTSRSASVYFQREMDKIIISNSSINELFVYHMKNDTTSHYSFDSKLTTNRQQKPSKNLVHSQEEFKSTYVSTGKVVSFSPFIVNPEQERYYRISYGKDTPQQQEFTYVLTVFDKNFNQISESIIPRRFYSSINIVKDNKIFFQHNIEDELAFVVMEVKEI
ncbi:DUF4221 domain-containing protein [Echinicola marina]|uniref:DUF4221 family protein n=1 Tax=Echinicola marina TaxID=2859768 RepID=UPI001CF701CD|nr:DUF4221 family protein [Echinicola marina]UCS94631.1 DUF4221 domain-containing protein [Echinicola marina]